MVYFTLLDVLGYDIYSTDVIPEYELNPEVKVDYALKVYHMVPVIISCKGFNEGLNNSDIQKLRNFSKYCGVYIIILTNGNDYWFYTNFKEESELEDEPYYKLKLTDDINCLADNLSVYSKESMHKYFSVKLDEYESFKLECRELLYKLKKGDTPIWLLQALGKRCDIPTDSNIKSLKSCFTDELERVFKL